MMALSGMRSSWLHARYELRLVLARQLQLAVLILDFVEQPHVLDRYYRLVGEGFDQFDLILGKRPDESTEQMGHANRDPLAQRATCDNRLSSKLQIKCTPDRLEHR